MRLMPYQKQGNYSHAAVVCPACVRACVLWPSFPSLGVRATKIVVQLFFFLPFRPRYFSDQHTGGLFGCKEGGKWIEGAIMGNDRRCCNHISKGAIMSWVCKNEKECSCEGICNFFQANDRVKMLFSHTILVEYIVHLFPIKLLHFLTNES